MFVSLPVLLKNVQSVSELQEGQQVLSSLQILGVGVLWSLCVSVSDRFRPYKTSQSVPFLCDSLRYQARSEGPHTINTNQIRQVSALLHLHTAFKNTHVQVRSTLDTCITFTYNMEMYSCTPTKTSKTPVLVWDWTNFFQAKGGSGVSL